VIPRQATLPPGLPAFTIADGLACDRTSTKSAFAVFYSPDCEYNYCTSLVFFNLNGRQITPAGGKGIERFFGNEAAAQKISGNVRLRETDP
jgi:hypothetical protein